MCNKQSLRSACANEQSDLSLCLSLEYSMSVRQPTEHHLNFLSLKGGSTGLSEATLVKMPHCWKSHVLTHSFYCRWSSQPVLSIASKVKSLSLGPDQFSPLKKQTRPALKQFQRTPSTGDLGISNLHIQDFS